MTVTFDRQVQIAGTPLPAGSYRFERLALDGFSGVVRVWSVSDGRSKAIVFTQTAPLREVVEQPRVEIGTNSKIEAWAYPGDYAKTVVVDHSAKK